MGTLYLVRHAQASLGAQDYDQLSALGERQSQRLGAHFARHGLRFARVLCGSLRRHQQTLQGLAQGAGWSLQPQVFPELNEYDSAALIRAIHPQALQPPATAEQARAHFRLLREALAQWMDGRIAPEGMPAYARFRQGVTEVLDRVRQQDDGPVLLVSSGGPIASAVCQVLQAPPRTAIDLNLRLRNTAVSLFDYSARRHMLVSFNTLPHLNEPADADLITHA
ncbi:MAG: histidine phosphatase family protein [Rhodoferax sp.]|nr:histidine phosphatase family protein [Rhodoferax sp.]